MIDTNKTLVSIIIPLYNSEEYISECLFSCMRQTYCNIEIIIVDDGSTDNGYQIVKELSKNDKRIKVYHTKNNGVSSARNLGIEKSSGEYICFIDADDCIDKIFVKTMVNYMKENDSDFCFSKNTFGNNNATGSKTISSSEAETMLLSQRVAVGCWNKMYRREILKDIRFRKDLFYGEGLYFINQVAHNAKNIVVCEDALYHYRKVNPESATTKFDIKKMVNGEKSLFEIKEFINNDGKAVKRMWSQHYCLFCINAMLGILRTSSDKKAYRTWKKKMSGKIFSAMISKGTIKTKLKIVISKIAPMCIMKKVVS